MTDNTQDALRVALEEARDDAKRVFKDGCNHTDDAIEYMHSLLSVALSAAAASEQPPTTDAMVRAFLVAAPIVAMVSDLDEIKAGLRAAFVQQAADRSADQQDDK